MPLADDGGCVAGVDPVDELERMEQQDALRSVIGGLAPCHQQILQLRYYDDLSLADIAGRVHCTPLAAKLRVFRAVSALRKRWHAGQ